VEAEPVALAATFLAEVTVAAAAWAGAAAVAAAAGASDFLVTFLAAEEAVAAVTEATVELAEVEFLLILFVGLYLYR
jgi:hypothetical protein